uniref:Uncharacterized protein n=1 Tax=Oryza nivara TaxID=4536 RepID=A0A0E0HZZ4_ORYNI
MATPAAAAAAKEVDKKVQLMKEIRAHEVAIGELNNLPPSRLMFAVRRPIRRDRRGGSGGVGALGAEGGGPRLGGREAAAAAVYQKTCNLFFRKSVKSAVTSEQKQLDMAKSRLQKLDQA